MGGITPTPTMSTMVIIEADNGKYMNLWAHLMGLADGIIRSARVTDQAIMAPPTPRTIRLPFPLVRRTCARRSTANRNTAGLIMHPSGHHTAVRAAGDLSPLCRGREGLQPWCLRVRVDVEGVVDKQLSRTGAGVQRTGTQRKGRVEDSRPP